MTYTLVQTVEAFCAEHGESVDTVMHEWPASRFEAMYEAYMYRKVAEDLRQRRAMEMAALWSNPNLDPTKDKDGNPVNVELRSDMLRRAYDAYEEAIQRLYTGVDQSEETEFDPEDPFFQAMYRGLEKAEKEAQERKRGMELPQGETVEDVRAA